MVRVRPFLLGKDGPQLFFHAVRGGGIGKADAVGDAEDVGVHGDLVVAKGGQKAPRPPSSALRRQGHQLRARGGHLAAVFLRDGAAGGDDVLRLVAVEAAFADLRFQLLGA